jgi:membrane fusion protein (multidrug efflux system)
MTLDIVRGQVISGTIRIGAQRMSTAFRKYGFAAVVACVLALAGGAAMLKGLTKTTSGGPGAAKPAVAGGPSAKPGPGRGDVPLVEAGTVDERQFADVVQALGTAKARESIIVAAKVTDVIRSMAFDSGDRVAKGQVLVVLSSIEQQADLDEARAALASAERDFTRFKDLGEKGFAPKARLDQAQAAYDQAKARVAAQESRMADRVIRAPFSGVMGLRSASPGALVRPGDAIATLDDISIIKLDFDVPEVHLTTMRPGAALSAVTAAYPGQAFTGTINDVDSRVDPASRTVKVRALIDNKSGALKPGMLMTVSVQSNPRMALAVPEMSILEKADGSSVFKVVQKDGKTVAAPAPVTIGARAAGWVEIMTGLKAGDQIVVEGVQRARPGQPIRVDAAKPTAGGGGKPAASAAGAARL